MRISTSEVRSQPAVREQATQTLVAGGSVTVIAPASAQLAGLLALNPLQGLPSLGTPVRYDLRHGVPTTVAQNVLGLEQTYHEPMLMAVKLAKDMTTDALDAHHPLLSHAIEGVFLIFECIDQFKEVKFQEKTVGSIMIEAANRRFLLTPRVEDNTVEIAIHPQPSWPALNLAPKA